jgi:next-to-BRCA1 protein 1
MTEQRAAQLLVAVHNEAETRQDLRRVFQQESDWLRYYTDMHRHQTRLRDRLEQMKKQIEQEVEVQCKQGACGVVHIIVCVEMMHRQIFCDGCNGCVQGIRWTCATCKDFDYCQSCYATRLHSHGIHYFYRIPFTEEAAQWPATERDPTQVSREMRAGCNACGKEIHGVRYDCLVCPDYDLCQVCIRTVDTIHPNHTFLQQIHCKDMRLVTKESVKWVHTWIVCDECGTKNIRGIRYKCAQCSSYDVCQVCIKTTTHHPRHTFLVLERPIHPLMLTRPTLGAFTFPGGVEDALAVHTNATCDHCEQPIVGRRYKCGMCEDFDLCVKCYFSNVQRHADLHVFIEFRHVAQLRAFYAYLTDIYTNSYYFVRE